jgi:hypothetical protein
VLSLSPAIVLAAAPLMLFLLNAMMDKYPIFGYGDLPELLRRDTRKKLRELSERPALLNSLGTLLKFSERVQNVIQSLLFSVGALLISNYSCTSRFAEFASLHLILVTTGLALLVLFFIKLSKGRYDPGAEGAAAGYWWLAAGYSFAVIAVDGARQAAGHRVGTILIPNLCSW